MDAEFLAKVRQAILNQDFDAAESLRDGPVKEHLPQLASWLPLYRTWEERDFLVHVVQDHPDPCLETLMRTCLDSPTVETRAVAICHLRNSFELFDDFLNESGWVEEELVDQAIATWRAEQ